MKVNVEKLVNTIKDDGVTYESLVKAISDLVDGIAAGNIELRMVEKKKPLNGCTIADDVKFEDAFMSAWAMGFDVFDWKGSRYSTTRKDGGVARKSPMITHVWEHQDA